MAAIVSTRKHSSKPRLSSKSKTVKNSKRRSGSSKSGSSKSGSSKSGSSKSKSSKSKSSESGSSKSGSSKSKSSTERKAVRRAAKLAARPQVYGSVTLTHPDQGTSPVPNFGRLCVSCNQQAPLTEQAAQGEEGNTSYFVLFAVPLCPGCEGQAFRQPAREALFLIVVVSATVWALIAALALLAQGPQNTFALVSLIAGVGAIVACLALGHWRKTKRAELRASGLALDLQLQVFPGKTVVSSENRRLLKLLKEDPRARRG